MSLELPRPQHMPCEECGASLARDEEASHECDHERWLDFNLFKLKTELDGFEAEIIEYLASPHGLFESYCAARQRQNRNS
jgi:hypothetical protein